MLSIANKFKTINKRVSGGKRGHGRSIICEFTAKFTSNTWCFTGKGWHKMPSFTIALCLPARVLFECFTAGENSKKL